MLHNSDIIFSFYKNENCVTTVSYFLDKVTSFTLIFSALGLRQGSIPVNESKVHQKRINKKSN